MALATPNTPGPAEDGDAPGARSQHQGRIGRSTHDGPRTTKVARIAALCGTIPQDLRDTPHWLVWKAKPDPRPGDPEHITKVPCIAEARGRLAPAKTACKDKAHRSTSCTCAQETWRTFDDAIATLAARSDVQGVGYVFTADDPYCGVDLDDCVDAPSGELTPTAQAIVDSFASYAEWSQSRKGVHILIRGAMPDGGKGRKAGDYEAYSQGRYFAITGALVDGAPATIEPRQPELAAFLAAHLPEKATKGAASSGAARVVPTVTLDDRALIDKAMRAANGAKFLALWNGGKYDKPSDSEADMALCAELRFWTGDDAARIDRLYRQSGRYTEARAAKWDRTGAETIARVIALGGPVYDPNAGTVVSMTGRRASPQAQYGSDATQADSDATQAEAGTTGEAPRAKPLIIGKNRQLDELTAEGLAALYDANADEPFLFRRNRTLARVRRDEHGRPVIEEVTGKILRTLLSEVADFGYYRQAGKDEEGEPVYEVVAMSPPDDLVESVLAQADWRFPTLDGLIEAPSLRPDGTIITQPGYDAATKLVYTPDATLTLGVVPDAPSMADVHKALETINDIIGDFPYDCAASRAHAYALLLTGVARPAIAGKVPLGLMTAPAAGTGKTLLASLPPMIATGRAAAIMTAPATEEEWGKVITTTLMAGPSFILIDNIRGKLNNAKLEAALTADIWQDRMLGANKLATLPQRAVWMAVGNNLMLGGDMPRRCYRIRLDAEMARPERRKSFKVKGPLLDHIKDHRGEILAALLTIARAWYAAGKPMADVTTMGGFEEWAQTIGSMLSYAGVDGFLTNLDDMYAEADTERPQWAAFFTAWYDTFGSGTRTASAVAKTICDEAASGSDLVSALPDDLAGFMTRVGELTRKLGYSLRKYERVRYELDDGGIVWVAKAGAESHSKTVLWRVIYKPTPTSPTPDHTSEAGAASSTKASPAAQTQTRPGLAATLRVMAGDVSSPITETENICVLDARTYAAEGSGGNHPPSPAAYAPAQALSGGSLAGDTFESPAADVADTLICAHPLHKRFHLTSGRIVCGECNATLNAPAPSGDRGGAA